MATADVQVPQKHKAAVYNDPGKISIEVKEIETPQPGPGEVLVNLTHSGVCHSDLGVMTSSWAALPYPTQKGQVGGHEGIGKIVKMGPGTENANVKVGDRVGIKWLASACGGCPACLEGHDGVCFNQKISGYYHPGTFQQYAIAPAHYVTPIPENLSSEAAAPLLCAGVTVYNALRKSNTQSGNWVVVLGAAGGLGHLACQFAGKGMGLRVIGVDAKDKEKLALDSGCEHFIGLGGEKTTAEQVKELTGGLGAHAVLVMTAANRAYAESCDMLRFGGTCVCVGIPEGKPEPIASALPQFIIAKELKIVGIAVGDRRAAIETLDFAARNLVKVHYRVEKMDKLADVSRQLRNSRS